ncbi:hypothetical protein JAAARDRAFT_206279 [Jaapia argillacea MUCL 33604]|uniref:Uncharacterized protein n=1 Tax=Jaapia argillacea MUCL 33604 TaxID=933084 RepID=A0A067Q4A5_9AGAM|nr:hypothetical protein JAAARDRAFT_206279 [Jaapia argillacea MUCL 33604]
MSRAIDIPRRSSATGSHASSSSSSPEGLYVPIHRRKLGATSSPSSDASLSPKSRISRSTSPSPSEGSEHSLTSSEHIPESHNISLTYTREALLALATPSIPTLHHAIRTTIQSSVPDILSTPKKEKSRRSVPRRSTSSRRRATTGKKGWGWQLEPTVKAALVDGRGWRLETRAMSEGVAAH